MNLIPPTKTFYLWAQIQHYSKVKTKVLIGKRVDDTFHRTDILGIKINPQNQNEVYVRVGVFEDFTCFEAAGGENPEATAKLEKEKCAGVYKSNDLGKTWQQLGCILF